ncbi:MAG: MCE family protein [Pseudonocardiales bacterium]|nr:MCE family protein [Pseudonocardiales bacterium]
MKRGRRAAPGVVALGLAGLLLSGCVLSGCGSITLQGVPLPGGADLGSEPFTVTAEFRDVLDLVPQASVRVNNVSVGQVKAIDLNQKAWYADVRMQLNGGVKLPANVTAQLKQTTLLGEKYVELTPPGDGSAAGALADGAVIPVQRTNRYPEVEEIFGALSMLLNGGGVGQLQTISQELNKALEGKEGDTRALLTDLNTLVGTLDGQRVNITRALDGVDKLSARLSDQRGNLDAVLTELEPGLAVLNEQRPQLVGMLKALDKLSGVATNVVDRSHRDLVADLEALRPTLRELAQSDDSLPKALEIFATPPFTDAAIKPIGGGFMNLDVKLDLDLGKLLNVLLTPPSLPAPPVLPVLPAPLNTLPVAPPPGPVSGLLPRAPAAPSAPGGLHLPLLGGN